MTTVDGFEGVDEGVGGAEDGPGTAGDTGGGWRDRAELFVSFLLLALGVVVLVDTATMADLPSAGSGPIGPKAVPTVLGAGLVGCAVLHAVDVLRGGRGEAEAGEDVDLGVRPDYRAVLLLVAVFLANALLIEPAGWVVSGALLFWGTAYALGSRHWLRDPAIAVALSLTSFYAFYYGLGITLPPGVLKGVL